MKYIYEVKFRKYIPLLLTFLLIMVFAFNADAQCAMCKASSQKSAYAKSLNQGIEYLLMAPVVILGSVLVIWVKNKDKFASKQ